MKTGRTKGELRGEIRRRTERTVQRPVKRREKWWQVFFVCMMLLSGSGEDNVYYSKPADLHWKQNVYAAATLDTEMAAAAENGSDSERENSAAEIQITDQLEDSDLQDMVDAMLGDKTFSVTEAFHRLLSGEDVLSEESVREFLHSLFFSGMEREKGLIVKLLLLLLFAAVFSGFAGAFDNGQIGEISFYVVYLLVFTLMMNSFSRLSESLLRVLGWITEFMKELSPVYFMAVAAASGASTAAVFYQGVLLLVWLFQWLLESILLPGVSIYILLKFVNHLSREEMLGKMAELIETLISWGLRSLLGLVAGLQIVKGLVAPVMDSLRRSAIGKTAGALPGVGNAVNAVTELVLTTAVLVRNSLGIALLLVIVAVGAGPLIHYGFLSLIYRFLAAVAQPVSDKRLVEAFDTMGEGCGLLLRILFTAEVLCMLTFLILMAGGN